MDARGTVNGRYLNRNKLLTSMGYASYSCYLKSDLWRSIRDTVLKQSNHRCLLCRKEATEVHHCEYTKAVLLGKDLSRLISICRQCHQKIEFDGDEKRFSTNDIAFAAIKIATRKSVKKALKPVCRCCQLQRKKLGRNDICSQCYKEYGKGVHARAEKQSR